MSVALRTLIIFAYCTLYLPALAAAPTDAQKSEFYATCMSIAQDDTLCACKAEAALTLIDARFMDIVIASMRGRPTAAEDAVPYNSYVAKSNQICKPNY